MLRLSTNKIIFLFILLLVFIGFFVYYSKYYRSDSEPSPAFLLITNTTDTSVPEPRETVVSFSAPPQYIDNGDSWTVSYIISMPLDHVIQYYKDNYAKTGWTVTKSSASSVSLFNKNQNVSMEVSFRSLSDKETVMTVVTPKKK